MKPISNITLLPAADKRALRLIRMAIERLQLNYGQKFNVMTEVGSGMYKFTPVIAAMAGAREVFACTRDSRYGKGSDNIKECKLVLDALEFSNVHFFDNEIPVDKIPGAHVITNSGFLRPLDASFLKNTDPAKTVIPLMFEAWEIRSGDIDINYCKEKNIRVAGTWENHPDIRVFEAVEILATKLALEAGFEVYQNKIAVWGDDHFGSEVANGFLKNGAEEVHLVNDISTLKSLLGCIDFIFLCDYFQQCHFFGPGGLFEKIENDLLSTPVGVVHLFGEVDAEYLEKKGISVYPAFKGHSGHMTFTLGHVGLKPIINLQCAGFKVAQEMLEGVLSDLSQPITFTG